jgi:hypothetical protein
MARGIQGPEGDQGASGYTYLTNMGVTSSISFTNPLTPVSAEVFNGAVYLNQASSFYVISFSPEILDMFYIPPSIPSVPGTWYVGTIFSAPAPADGSFYPGAPSSFDLSQLPVTLFFQNVGGVPINVIFGSNGLIGDVTYLSYGTGPSATPSAYVIPPLGILVIEAIFTGLNVIRFYNSFLDSLNPNRYYRIVDRASKAGYFSPAPIGPSSLTNYSTLTITSDYTFSVLDATNHYSQNVIKTQGSLTLTIDGTNAPPLGETSILVQPSEPINVSLVNLVNSRNFQGKLVPSVLDPVDQFFVITGNRIVLYDSGGGVSLSTISAVTKLVLETSFNFIMLGAYYLPTTQNLTYVPSYSFTDSGFTFTLNPGNYELQGVLTAYGNPPEATVFSFELIPASVTTSPPIQTFTVTGEQEEIVLYWKLTLTERGSPSLSSIGSFDVEGTFTLNLMAL